MAGTSVQLTWMEVEDRAAVVTLLGGEAGANGKSEIMKSIGKGRFLTYHPLQFSELHHHCMVQALHWCRP